MAGNIFLDTSGLYSFLVKTDAKHRKTSSIIHRMVKDNGYLITTDYIIDETVTLLRARGYGPITPNLFDGIMSSRACRMEWMDQDFFHKTKALFLKYHDHEWSFTDCFSFVVMKSSGLKNALTKDIHFLEAGFVPLLK